MKIGKAKERVLVIPDLQIPAIHQDAVEFLIYLKKKLKPTKVVQIGDMVDFHALSDFDIGDAPGLSHELATSVEILKPLYKAFPNVEYILGNHEDRLRRRLRKASLPEKQWTNHLREYLELPDGWNIHPIRHKIDDVKYIHGNQLAGGGVPKSALSKTFMSTVYGHHTQNVGTHYKATEEGLYFGFNVGCLADSEHMMLDYAKLYVDRPILGAGFVNKGCPFYFPMLLNENNRWIKRSKK